MPTTAVHPPITTVRYAEAIEEKDWKSKEKKRSTKTSRFRI